MIPFTNLLSPVIFSRTRNITPKNKNLDIKDIKIFLIEKGNGF